MPNAGCQHHWAAHVCGLAALLQKVPKAAHVGVDAPQHLCLLAKVVLHCLLDFAVSAGQVARSSAAGLCELANMGQVARTVPFERNTPTPGYQEMQKVSDMIKQN